MTLMIGDSETDGLLDKVTKFHCIGFTPSEKESNKFYIFCDLEDLSNFDQDQFKTDLVDPLFFPTNDYVKLIDSPKTTGVCFHNILSYDLEVFHKLSGIKYDWKSINGRNIEIIDTLVWSQYLWPDRPIPKGMKGSHGLAAWGLRLGIKKPEVEDWSTQPLNVYIHRLIEDIRINKATYWALKKEIEDVALPNGDKKGQWELPLKMAHKTRYLMFQQEKTGVCFDIEGAKKLVERIDKEMKEIEDEVEPRLGIRTLPMNSQPKFPSSCFKKPFDIDRPYTSKGGLKKPVKDYLNLIGITENQEGYIESLCDKEEVDGVTICRNNIEENLPKHPNYLTEAAKNWCLKFGIEDIKEQFDEICKYLYSGEEYPRLISEKLKLSHKKDVKLFLIKELNWLPSLYKVRNILIDPKTKQKLSKEETNKKLDAYIKEFRDSEYWPFILQELGYSANSKVDPDSESFRAKCLRNGRNLISSAQYTDNRGELCPNLEKIDADIAKKICRWLSLQNRRNTILSENETGWLMHPRLQIDGRLPAGASGITPTFRKKHSVCVNVPKADEKVLLGEEFRSLFYAPDGYVNVGGDGISIEALCASHYTIPFDGGKYSEAVLGGSFHDNNAVYYSKAAGFEITRSEGKNITYACLPIDNTTVLTRTGWKQYNELNEGQEILTYNVELDRTEFQPIQKLHFFKNQEIIKKYNSQWEFESTKDHRWYGSIRREIGHRGVRYYSNEFFKTEDIKSTYQILNSAKFVGGDSDITPDEASIIAWILSDGYIKWNKISTKTSSSFGRKRGVLVSICQSENKYYKEIIELLRRNNIKFKHYIDKRKNENHIHRFIINSQYIRNLWEKASIPWGIKKTEIDWSEFVINLSKQANDAFIHTWYLAEGYMQRNTQIIAQNRNNLSDCILLSATLAGYNCSTSKKSGCKNECIDIRLKERRHTTAQRFKERKRFSDVFCVTTNNSTFIAKQGDQITITGNCTYGASYKKIAKMMSVSDDIAKKLIDGFWEANPGLLLFKEALEKYWESTGSKYIYGLDGRKVFTRSRHSLTNTAFQHTGALILDFAQCYIYDKIKENNLDIQRWGEFHDEAQAYENRKEIKVYYFDIDKKPEQERDGILYSKPKIFRNNKIIHHPIKEDDFETTDKWIQFYAPFGHYLDEGFKEASKYFKTNVEFRVEYMVGKRWNQCH